MYDYDAQCNNRSETGGIFANGAYTTAFQYLFNEVGQGGKGRHKNRNITVSTGVNMLTASHYYRIRGFICNIDTAGCDAGLADETFAYVNEHDVPFSIFDDPGDHSLLFSNPIRHDEFIRARYSLNTALEGHIFEGTVSHSVHFENGNLYYDVVGTGTGGIGGVLAPYINNEVGVRIFSSGVGTVTRKFGR